MYINIPILDAECALIIQPTSFLFLISIFILLFIINNNQYYIY